MAHSTVLQPNSKQFAVFSAIAALKFPVGRCSRKTLQHERHVLRRPQVFQTQSFGLTALIAEELFEVVIRSD